MITKKILTFSLLIVTFFLTNSFDKNANLKSLKENNLNKSENKANNKHYQGEVIDIHNHILFDEELGSLSEKYKGTTSEILNLTKNSKINKHCIITMAHFGKLDKTKENNDKIIQISKKNTSFIPIGSVHPDDGVPALIELERISKLGVKIIKIHPSSQNIDIQSKNMHSLVNRAGELHVAILFDGYNPFDANYVGNFVKLAIANPNTQIILAHLGAAKFSEFHIFMFLNKYKWYKKNVWFDISAVVSEYAESPYKDQLIWTINSIGTNRMLFGSDFPMYNPKDVLDSFYKLGFTNKIEKQILHDNYYELLKKMQ